MPENFSRNLDANRHVIPKIRNHPVDEIALDPRRAVGEINCARNVMITVTLITGYTCRQVPIMGDLKSPMLIKMKGLLFLVLGLIAAALLLAEHPSLRVAILLAITIWSFCRFYYFAFYVIEHYVDGQYRFSGLWDFAKYLWRNQRSRSSGAS